MITGLALFVAVAMTGEQALPITGPTVSLNKLVRAAKRCGFRDAKVVVRALNGHSVVDLLGPDVMSSSASRACIVAWIDKNPQLDLVADYPPPPPTPIPF